MSVYNPPNVTGFLKLDQTTPQSVINGQPNFVAGLKFGGVPLETNAGGTSVAAGTSVNSVPVNSVMLGTGAGFGANISTSNFIAIGANAGRVSNKNLSNCVHIGAQAGYESDGNSNAFVGQGAGGTSSGGSNVALGANAMYGTISTSSIAIGSSSFGASNNPGGGNFAAGYQAGNSSSGLQYCTLIGDNAGGYLTGTVGFFAAGSQAGYFGTNLDNTILIGGAAGASAINFTNSVAIGSNASNSATGSVNLHLGFGAGSYSNGSQNINIGQSAGANTIGNSVTAMGEAAGSGNLSVTNSFFLGKNSGVGALYAGDTMFIGQASGLGATHASKSVFLGLGCGNSALFAANSIFIGNQAGNGDTVYQPITGRIGYASVLSSGMGWNVNDVATVTSGNGDATVTVTNIISGAMSTVSIADPGINYLVGEVVYLNTYSNDGYVQIDGIDGNPGVIATHQLYAGGSGYTIGDNLYLSNGYDAYISVDDVDGGGAVIAYTLQNTGVFFYAGISDTTGGTGTGCQIEVLTIEAGTGAPTAISVGFQPGTAYDISTGNTTGYITSSYYQGSGLTINVDSIVNGSASTVSVSSGGTGGYIQGGFANENPATGAGTDLYIIINTLTNTVDGASSMLIGNYTSTGGFSNSVAIGQGTANSAVSQMNLGNVLFLDGIYSSTTTSSTPISIAKMTMLGGQVLGYKEVTATYTVLTTDYTINCTANTFTVNLPTAVGATGQVYNIKNTGTGIITVDGNGSETIDGVTTQTLTQYDCITIQSTGSAWIII